MQDRNLPNSGSGFGHDDDENTAAASLDSPQPDPPVQAGATISPFDRGRVTLDPNALRALRHDRMMSQQDLADDCWRRNIRVSIATIKRAECGQAVRFRIVRELARCFEVPVERLLRAL